MIRVNVIHFCFAFYFLLITEIFPATKTWNNTSGGSWATGSNWTPNGAPAANDDVIIPALTNSAMSITNVPQITLNSLTFTGSGTSWLCAAASGNSITIRNSWTVPAGYSVTIGNSGQRICMTLSTTCIGTLDGYCAFDAGNTNRPFLVYGSLIVNSTGMLYDPNPTGGSDFYLFSGATLKTQKAQGITTVAATSAATVNYSVAVSFGGSYFYNSGANYEYNGTTGQITGNGLNQNIPNSLTVNLSSGNTLTLTSNTTVSGSVTLSSGYVNLNSNTLTLGTSAAIPGTLIRTSGHLFGGKFTRWFTTTSIPIADDKGLFPMGGSIGDYRPLWVANSANLTTAGVISVVHNPVYPATYIPASHTDASWGNTLQGVSNSDWTVSTSTLAFNGATGMLRYGGTGFGTNVLTDLDATLLASVVGTHGAATNINTTYEVNRTTLTTANITNAWRIGSKNVISSPLPITLLYFNAAPANNSIDLYWATQTETNSDNFIVEKSKNGIDFEYVGMLKGAGNSSALLKYFLKDDYPYDGINYYRLKQTDLDQSFKYSSIVAVKFNNTDRGTFIYPNPSQGILKFFNNDTNGFLSIEIFNSLGEKIYHSDVFAPEIDLSNKADGIYFFTINKQGKSSTEKFVIDK